MRARRTLAAHLRRAILLALTLFATAGAHPAELEAAQVLLDALRAEASPTPEQVTRADLTARGLVEDTFASRRRDDRRGTAPDRVAQRQRAGALARELAEAAHGPGSREGILRTFDLARIQRADLYTYRSIATLGEALEAADALADFPATFRAALHVQYADWALESRRGDLEAVLDRTEAALAAAGEGADPFRAWIAFTRVRMAVLVDGADPDRLDAARAAVLTAEPRDSLLAQRTTLAHAAALAARGRLEASLELYQEAVRATRGRWQSVYCLEAWREPADASIDLTRRDTCSQAAHASGRDAAQLAEALTLLSYGVLDRAGRRARTFERRGSLAALQLRLSHALLVGDLDLASRISALLSGATYQQYGPDHPAMIESAMLLTSRSLLVEGDPDLASLLAGAALQLSQREEPGADFAQLDMAELLGQLRILRGELDEGRALLEQVAAGRRTLLAREGGTLAELEADANSLNRGIVDFALGRYEGARATLEATADRYRRSLGPSPTLAAVLLATAELYSDAGQHARAEAYLAEYETLASEIFPEGSLHHPAGALRRVMLELDRGEFVAARTRLDGILADPAIRRLKRAAPLRPGLVGAEAELLAAEGRPGEAADTLATLLELPLLSFDSVDRALLLAELALKEIDAGRLDAAAEHVAEATAMVDVDALPRIGWRLRHATARLLAAQGAPAVAIALEKDAIEQIRRLSAEVEQFGTGAARRLAQAREAPYRTLADLLLAEGRLGEAEAVLRMLREEEVGRFLRRADLPDDLATLASSDAEHALVDTVRRSGREVAALAEEVRVLRRKVVAGRADDTERARLEEGSRALQDERRAFRTTLLELAERYRALGGERAVDFGRRDLESLAALQGVLRRSPAREAVLHTLVLPDRLHLLLTTESVQLHRQVTVDERTLTELVRRLREGVLQLGGDHLAAAQGLHGHLLAPLAADLEELGVDTLVIAPDRALRYLPFAALHDGERYLVERFDVARYTSAARHALAPRPLTDARGLAFGVTRAHGGFAALPAVEAEVDAVIREGERDALGVVDGHTFLDEAFTRETLSIALSGAETPPAVLHLASHFAFQPGSEEDSFLLLGDGSRLSLADLRYGDFPLQGIELLALSACETGVAGEGTEIEGFATLAQNQGAAAVVATLWAIADDSTAAFMERLYARRVTAGATNASAMAAVQRAFLAGEDVPEHFAHPYFWAPYTLAGNWL